MDEHRIAAGTLAATIRAQGAELCSLTVAGRELMWGAGPAWPRHAPVLFPIVGRLVNDSLWHAGAAYPMGQHGFARDRRFAWVDRGPHACRLALTDDDGTRAAYPFAFRLELSFTLSADALTIGFAVTNPGPGVLPASVGAHPAFRWPLLDGVAKTDHAIVFQSAEPAALRRVAGGLLQPGTVPTPVVGDRLALSDALFAHDALIWEQPRSRAARLVGPDGHGLQVTWSGFRELGIWSKPADFVCIEPWRGHASPADFTGDIMDKPGIMRIGPGQTKRLELSISPV